MGRAMTPTDDVIAAIATAPGRAGIGVVRVSGARLASFAERLLGRVPAPRHATRATFRGDNGSVIDDGLALWFPAPHSYTGEDVLELQAHGGPVVLRMLLASCVALGARLAEPGEFTRRAFLNDRLDLAQAESVAALIDASTEAAARAAMRSLQGEFSARVNALVARLIELRMRVEATLDFPEEEIDAGDRADADARLAAVGAELDRTLAAARQGALLRSGVHVVLAGQPNVGKSSLLNRLAGEDLAIVTPVAGTTRDAVRQGLQIDGVPLVIVDTAGLRDTHDDVERIGIARTWSEIERADLLLLVVDAREGVTAADEAIAARLPAKLARLVVRNKIDLAPDAAAATTSDGASIAVSARTGEGLAALQRRILELAGWRDLGEGAVGARERHVAALERARERLEAARRVIEQPELFAEELRLAQAALDEITGRFSADDLLGEIFGRFCIGK
jgi:tRNA modification GTPase